MKKIQLHAYAKINLTLDVTGRRPDGYHDVEMIIQQICEVMKSRNPESFVAKTTGQDRHRDVTREGKHVEF